MSKIKVELKDTEIKREDDYFVNYLDWIKSAILFKEKSGMGKTLMRSILSVKDAFEGANPGDKVEVSDLDARFLKELVSDMFDSNQWTLAHRNVLEFDDYIQSLI